MILSNGADCINAETTQSEVQATINNLSEIYPRFDGTYQLLIAFLTRHTPYPIVTWTRSTAAYHCTSRTHFRNNPV